MNNCIFCKILKGEADARFEDDGHRMGFSGTDPDESSRDKLNKTAKLIADKL
ncbi:hypothetical protein M902_2357 [Bacteriovorax sp. BAL6_X]|uniref:hypothetical protein n=1 Tax=Bacteriovorax sp. BAL6_X TaxID=1201290 RepID=UPI000385E14F|nr:hypothetical protein [Bacteriovorax sp. BAL6_X]EPZ51935.1 hypothetical protein M902_2357 [Bacteriovorax sp. BAL6_X]